MIEFFTVRGFPGSPSASPFCGKLDVWLQLSGLEFKRRGADPRKAPNGKMPYVSLDGGPYMGDSQRIIEHLTETRGVSLDDHLTPVQRATGHLIRRTIEEATYFLLMHARWLRPVGFEWVRENILGDIPALMKPILVPMIRRKVHKDNWAQGTARHDEARIDAMARADFDALAAIIGDGPYALGDQPSSVDATTYAFLAMVVHCPYPDPLRDYIRTLTPLTGYCERMAARLEGEGPASS